MFNPRIKTAADLKEAAKRARAAQIEEERRPRIFNVKNRVIGIDVAALDKQIQEKETAKAAIKAEDEAYLALQKFEAKRLKEIGVRIEEEKKRQFAQLLEYRKEKQKMQERKEFDLNDPDMKRKDLPCRLGDDDPRLTISSMQKFEGDEGSAAERRKIQDHQKKVWLIQQIKEKREQEAAKAAAEAVLLETARANDQRVRELEEAEKKCKTEMDRAIRQYNYIMYKEKEAEKELEKKREMEDILMHINNMMNSDLLSGSTQGQPSQLSLDKVTKSSFRGMPEDELKRLKEEQLRQIEEHREKKREEEQREADWLNFQRVQSERYIEAKEKNQKEKRRQELEILEENKLLAEKQKAHRRYLDEHVYKGAAPEPYFYEQFNKTTR